MIWESPIRSRVPEYSAYELYGISGCFSHMTHEQLVNWMLCAAVYVEQSGDQAWLSRNLSILKRWLGQHAESRPSRPCARNGMMALDSSRTMGGAEITTYDSLDVSLGQARNNIYLAGQMLGRLSGDGEDLPSKGLTEWSRTAASKPKRCGDDRCPCDCRRDISLPLSVKAMIPELFLRSKGLYSHILRDVRKRWSRMGHLRLHPSVEKSS